MKESRIIALMIVLAGLQTGLILVGILPPLSVNTLANILFLLARIAIIGYAGWIFSGLGFKEVAIKGGIVTLASVIPVSLATFIGMMVHKPVLGINFTSQIYLLINLLIIAIINVMLGAVLAVIGALIGRKFIK